jgi:hypothetical protein
MLMSMIPGMPEDPGVVPALAATLAVAMALHLALLVFENLMARSPTRHRTLAVTAIRRGAFARLFWGGAVVIPALAITISLGADAPVALAAAAVLALAGSFAWDYVWVEAGQSVPLS